MSQEHRLIYVGVHDGVYACSGNGAGRTWEQLPISLPSVAVGALAVAG